MSQWNNSYVYNNQYQGTNNWNGEVNGQYINQGYYPRPEGSAQYVGFEEFLNQMQSSNAMAGNTANYNNAQYDTYPAQQYRYHQNMPSTSQTQLGNYNYNSISANMPSDINTYQQSAPSQYQPQPEPTYTSDVVINSNLTATANEFVPKNQPQSSTNTQNIPAPANNHNVSNEVQSSYQKKPAGSSSDKNWRERSQTTQSSETENPTVNGYSNDRSHSNNSRNRDTYRNNEGNSKHYESRNQDNNSKDYEAADQYQESNCRNTESNSRSESSYYEGRSRNNDNRNRNYEGSSRNHDSSNHSYESNTRNQDSSSRSQENQSRNHDNRNSRNYESNNRNQEFSRNQELSNRNPDSNSRGYEPNSRNERRNQPKNNSKYKGRESDNRTFYNSSMPKDQDVRGGRGENSGRNKTWGGSQRLRAAERNTTEDEQYANSYVPQKEEKYERERAPRVQNSSTASPVKFRNRQGDQVNKEMTQRERLADQLDKGTLECLVCCDRVKQMDPVWSCSSCYHVLHLRCIRKWAMSSMVEGKWRCPPCQNPNDTIPTEYRCMCGAVRNPEYNRTSGGAHTCGRSCRRPRACPHPCTLLCHPGPCPPCQATVTRQCGCGVETRSILCSSKLAQVCGRVCNRSLECGVHTCTKECHEAACDTCGETVQQVCHCPAAQSRSVPCTRDAGATWSCGGACGRVLACGAHVCRAACHAVPCEPCALRPAAVRACPCGKMRLEADARKSCTDPIPLCGNICAKPLPCGPAGDKHFCKQDCHEGPCPVCPDKTLVQCRCGHSSREIPCADLPEMLNNVLCQKKCNKKLSCGRHRCRATCCAGGAHRCAVPCGRSLACGTHRCEDFCHTGHCAPCPRVSFSELTCECGAQVVLPPVRCGTRPPACEAPCRRARSCGHPPHHNCHSGECPPCVVLTTKRCYGDHEARSCGHPPHHHCNSGECPPCVVLTTKRCYGDHEERKTIPCSQDEFSCGLPCGKPLPCGKHTCIKICHKGPCDTGKCTQPCMEKRPSCGHPCAAPCHASEGGACPSAAACRRLVRASCPCGRRHAERTCSDNARDLAKMMSALAATKMQESGSVDLSEVQRPANMLKTLECDDECRVEARTRQLALALQIRNPDVSAKLAPRYNDNMRATAAKEPAFAQQIHDALTDLVQRAKKSKQKTRSHSFPSMNWQKRQFIHELCEHFGCESVAYDAEPNRNVVATADREKSWLPAMSVLEVVAREAGKRRVPGPVLRAPTATARAVAANAPASNKSSGSGWATLTSSNAWAARSQPKPAAPTTQPPEAKIDYFDNPPDN